MIRILLLISFIMAPQMLWAKKVYSPHSDEGEIELESQTDIVRSNDPLLDGKIRQQIELAAGLTDWWHSGIYVVYEKQPARSGLNYTASKWENIFVLPGLNDLPLDAGIYVEYIHSVPSSTTSDAIEAQLLLEWHADAWRHILNLGAKQVLASSAAAPSLGYAWRTQYALTGMELAVEAYGNLGRVNQLLPLSRQSHLIGPVVTFSPWDDFEFELGWLMDTNAGPAYGDLKINMELEF